MTDIPEETPIETPEVEELPKLDPPRVVVLKVRPTPTPVIYIP